MYMRVAKWIMILLVPMFLAPIAKADTPPLTINVLFLSSYRIEGKGAMRFKDGLHSAWDEDPSVNVNFFPEYMDMIFFKGKDHEQHLFEFYRSKYQNVKIDAIVSHASPALDFLLEHKEALFPDAPVVFALVSESIIQKRKIPSNYIGITSGPDFATTVATAVQLLPKTENLLIVGGTSPVDRQYLSIARKQLRPFDKKLKIDYLSQVSMDDMLEQVATLPKRTVIVYALIQQDGTGKQFIPNQAASQIATVANAPVFALSDTMINSGVLGGMLMSLDKIGRQSAKAVLEIIKRKSPQNFIVYSQNTRAYMFDWRQLKRWGIDEARLPPGSVVLNKETTFWGQYYKPIIVVALFIIIETMLITLLLINRSKRIRAEGSLRESVQYYRTLFDDANEGLFTMTRDGKLKDVNQAFANMHGYSIEELKQMHIEDIDVLKEDALEKRSEIMRRIDAGEIVRFEVEHYHRDGRVLTLNVTTNMIKLGDTTYYLAFHRDITEKKQIMARLQQMQKIESLGIIAGGIAHDFNNILFPIMGKAELLLEDLPKDSSEHQNVRDIFEAGKRGSDLVKQILAFSRQTELEKIPVKPQQILKEVVKLIRSTIPANIQIRHHLQNDCGLIFADPTQLHQIAMNLLTNAFHAVEPNNGTISIELKEKEIEIKELPGNPMLPGRYAIITVSDTGVGINPNIMGKIFDPYFTTKERGKGTGLGLAMVYGIVKEHGGEIRVDSRPGEGTAVSIYLPLIAERDGPAQGETLENIPKGSERILLVDDENSVATVAKQILERLGYKVSICMSSAEALEMFRADASRYDLVITDMTMPEMTGDILARMLINIRPDIPIIICTGFSEKIDKSTAIAIGIKDFLMKPVTMAALGRTVKRVLNEAGGNAQNVTRPSPGA